MSDERAPPVALASSALSCTIDPLGAELLSLTDAAGHDWLWNGDPVWWGGRAPILFPVVGMLAGGGYRWRGAQWRLDKHGFARRRHFALVAHDAGSATFRLTADPATKSAYPFDFELDLNFVIDRALTVTATVTNHGAEPMPFSFGYHPALRWPREAPASILFDAFEGGPVMRIDGDGLIATCEPLAGDGLRLDLDDGLFANDAMILRGIASRGLRFRSGAGEVHMTWSNLPDLGLWTKPGAPFLCIEPWAGFNDPVGFSGELDKKPGIVCLAPDKRWSASMTIEVRGQS
jgi:galactose mutarotase-like enzyme